MTIQEWLGKENQLGIDIWERKYKYNNETFEDWLTRVSGGNNELRELIKQRKFLFGGRALANRGTNKKGSMNNCYSSGYCGDSIQEITQLNTNLALTYKSQGGQGLSLSKIRPKGSKIGDNFTSDGIIPFMEMFNITTGSISQGGARKGALMMSLDIRHKDAPEFITIKTNEDKITNANLSLEIDDEFMRAVDSYYTDGETITLHEKRTYGDHVVEYDIIPINLYKLMIDTVYDWGEPGCIFTNLFRNYNLMEFDEDYQIATCNPCGEQPMPANFSCNLGSINLSEFVEHPYTADAKFNLEEFEKAVRIGVRALDDIIDDNLANHALIEQAENAKNYRNIGLGVFAYANMLFMLGVTYGSQEAQEFTDIIFKLMFKCALQESNRLAKEKGAFPKCKPDAIVRSTIIKNLKDDKLINNIAKYGLRNCSLLSIAPTGSIATMVGCSGGCEPEFALSYNRRTINLNETYKVYCKSVKEYCQINNTSYDDLPSYFVASENINWHARIKTQCIMQKWVDTAISSTINLPEHVSKDEIEKIYLEAWKHQLKGITLFRSNCKRLAILSTSDKQETTNSEPKYDTIVPVSRKTMGTTHGSTYCKKCACGTLYITVNADNEGNVVETFVESSKGGVCKANTAAVNRMVSLAMRSGVKIDEIVDQLKGIDCPACTRVKGQGKQLDGLSCPDIIGRTIKEFYDSLHQEKSDSKRVVTNPCPECGEQLNHEGGCDICPNCGYSKCG